MTVWPVIQRELRAECRRSLNYRLRCVGAAAGAIYLGWSYSDAAWSPQMGLMLFQALHILLFIMVWVLAVFLTADCLSRERREGTFGLLLLTPLRPWEMVVGKVVVHGLRATGLVLSMLPLLVIPILLGGVEWRYGAISVCILAGSLLLGLASGVWCSARNTRPLRSLGWAIVLSLLLMELLNLGFAWMTLKMISGPMRILPDQWWHIMMDLHRLLIFCPQDIWFFILGSLTPGQALQWLGSLLLLVGVAALALIGSVLRSAARLQRVGNAEAVAGNHRSKWRQGLLQTLTRPTVAPAFYRRWLRRRLEQNPVGWLEQRIWTGRISRWVWLAVLGSIVGWSVVGMTQMYVVREDISMVWALGGLLAFHLAYVVANSFHRERESGVIELLLVTPMSEARLVWGRWRGLWGQFLPAFALWAVWWWLVSPWMSAWYGYYGNHYDHRRYWFLGNFLATTVLSLPVGGLYFSLRCQNFAAAFFSIVGGLLLLPTFGLAGIANLLVWGGEHWFPSSTGFAFTGVSIIRQWQDAPVAWAWPSLAQLGLAAGLGWRLWRRLKRRRFAFQLAQG